MEHQGNQIVIRISKLAKQNKELSEELRKLRDAYNELMRKNEEYEQIVSKYTEFAEVKEILSTEKSPSLKFNMVTVLYADIHGFSEILPGDIPEKHSQKLMDQLDYLFMKFDEIIAKYPIEKIKTIGDSYMCAGGIPEKNITNPVEVVLAAFEIIQIVYSYCHENKAIWEIRLGVHTGPVTAVASGKIKITYDIKGDTVNIASRLESSGIKGKVLISVMTYELVKEFFDCEYYGKLPVKYKGNLDIYVVKGIKPELSVNRLGIEPDQQFRTKFALIQFHDLQELILDMLEKELPSDLYYHNLKHTVDVVTEVELIGWAEGVTDEEVLLLKTAALFHDAGHTISYDNHEFHGCEICRQILPRFNYSKEQIKQVCKLIMVTRMPPLPGNLLEEIMCDSDLDYLGRIDFIPVSNTLFEELKVRDKIGSLNDWNKMQLKFITNHQYFTHTARKLREVNKQIQIERIRKLIT
jgi:class 3 adenylate cyclase